MKKTERILPTYEMIEVSKIEVAEYQRPIKQHIVKGIVKNFNPSKMGPIMISLRDGKYFVFDGQHRLSALRIMGIEFVMCEVHRKLTYAEESELFYTQSENCRRVSAAEIFYGKLEAKDELSLKIQKVANENGFQILRSGGGKSHYKIAAIQMLCDIEKLHGLDNLEKTLSLISKTWKGSPESTDSKMLMGVSLFLKSNEVEESKFIKRLSKVEPVEIIRKGVSDITNKEYKRFATVILNYYNKNTSKNRLVS